MTAKLEDLASALAAAHSAWDLKNLDFNAVKEGTADLVARLHKLEQQMAAIDPHLRGG